MFESGQRDNKQVKHKSTWGRENLSPIFLKLSYINMQKASNDTTLLF